MKLFDHIFYVLYIPNDNMYINLRRLRETNARHSAGLSGVTVYNTEQQPEQQQQQQQHWRQR